ncbi:MAG: DUF3987 domain-containing protein, partial [Acetobacteraceae bacterium]|nr:DUF3987 domain-containing protein [Acetobacteraceae bacterium]
TEGPNPAAELIAKAHAGATTRASEPPADQWPAPAMSILRQSARPAPPLPMGPFGPAWGDWLARTADAANAPVDYTAAALLSVASALVGNARWVCAWPGWAEPPVLWCCAVGNPSAGKSSGASPVTRTVLRKVEARMAEGYPAARQRYEELAAVAGAAQKQWEKDVAAALAAGKVPPKKPDLAAMPEKPVRPRASVGDATIEKLGELQVANPKGVAVVRDELAGLTQNMGRYSGGTDQPFYLEGYNGGPYQVDRQKNPEPLFIRHLTLAMFGTTQPDRIPTFTGAADDGFASRFLWVWPEPKPFAQPGSAGDTEVAALRLQRLADLKMGRDEEGACPVLVSLAPDAQKALAAFARDVQAREHGAHGLMKSSLGKARGQALRLALVLEYLWWSIDATAPQPEAVGPAAMGAAVELMHAYFLPMAARVLGDASISAEERNARTLAAWIVETRPDRLNVSAIRDNARLPGLRESEPVKAACRFLAEAGWLREPPRTGAAGRPRGDWTVNPRLWGGAA